MNIVCAASNEGMEKGIFIHAVAQQVDVVIKDEQQALRIRGTDKKPPHITVL
jgi:hypothetical protein